MPPFIVVPGSGGGSGDGVLLRIKAVPGAKRDEIVGTHGDRLKVRVSQPPEGGKANAAICALIAGVLGVGVRDVEVTAGHTSPMKTVRVLGVTISEVGERLRSVMG